MTISPEVTGRVVDVSVSEGDSVKAGDILFKLDDTLLAAQLNQAQTNLAAAQAGLEAANTALAAAQAGVTTAQAQYDQTLGHWRACRHNLPAALPGARLSHLNSTNLSGISPTQKRSLPLRRKSSAASDALATAKTDFNSLISSGTYTNLVTTETRLANAQAGFPGCHGCAQSGSSPE